MKKIMTIAATLAFVATTAYAENTKPETKTPIKFPIVEMQYPDLRTTVRAPKVFWRINSMNVVPQQQNHIISPLFYYQTSTKK